MKRYGHFLNQEKVLPVLKIGNFSLSQPHKILFGANPIKILSNKFTHSPLKARPMEEHTLKNVNNFLNTIIYFY
jgi:hypothetical protein